MGGGRRGMCEKNGPRITNGSELLRQVFPGWLNDDGVPSSQAFYPWRDVDDGCLSVDRATMVTPAEAFVRFTAPKPLGFGQPAVEVWGITVEEVTACELTAWEDPVPEGEDHPANPSHALVEFGGVARSRWGKIGKRLKACAIQRGRRHP